MKEDADKDKGKDTKIWGAFLFGLIGATVTTFAVGQLRRSVEWFYVQLSKTQSSRKGESGGSFRSAFQEEAWRRHNKRLQEEYEEEMERVERIRRMQSVFNRERNKYKRSYESWRENDPGAYHQHFQREDWYWKADTSFRDRRTNYQETPRESGHYGLSHHYSVLGLERYSQKSWIMLHLICGFIGNTMFLLALLEEVQYSIANSYYRKKKMRLVLRGRKYLIRRILYGFLI
ncbi:hypothetical protein E2542_SST03710 [Spatholobus suberectus]|nr:hypothetical protein E2542_SST03710 [Spatholobus suberectus]